MPTRETTMKAGRLSIIYLMWVGRSILAEGEWGAWKTSSKCPNCLAIRYRHNCTRTDPRPGKSWNPEGICDTGTYFERINPVVSGRCFVKDAVATEDYSRFSESNSSQVTRLERELKNDKMWKTGQSTWTRCSRQAGRPKASVYNRRGRKARAYYCPIDNYTVWKEEWAYCCAGAWSQWQTISECPPCGGGVRRRVRICGIPGVPFDVETLSQDGEFLRQWTKDTCEMTHCKLVDNKVISCRDACGTGEWDRNTECMIGNNVTKASLCCKRGYRGLPSSCVSQGFKSPKNQRAVLAVAIILGIEALLIIAMAVIVTLLNIGKAPFAITRAVGTWSCLNAAGPAEKAKPTPTTAKQPEAKKRSKYVKGKRLAKLRSREEIDEYLNNLNLSRSSTVCDETSLR